MPPETELAPGETLPERPDAPAPSQTFADFSRQILQAEESWRGAREREAEGLRLQAAEMRPRIEAAQQTISAVGDERSRRVAALDAAQPKIQQPPSRQLHEFLAPGDSREPPGASITKFITALSVLGTGIGGLAKGDARAGLAALSGAMQGWHEGDKQKADRQFSDWKARTDAALSNFDLELGSYQRWFENANLSIEQMLAGLKLDAMKHGNDQALRAFETGTADSALKWMTQAQQHADQVEYHALQIKKAYDLAQLQAQTRADIAKSQQDLRAQIAEQNADLRRQQLDQQAEFHRMMAQNQAMGIQERTRHNQAVESITNLTKQIMLDTPIRGAKYYDKTTGDIRELSRGEWIEDNQKRKAGQGAGNFTPLTNQQVSTVERLSIAPKILDRIDQIVDKVNAVAPGQNLTTGLINKLATKAGVSADLQELRSLNVDAALELAAALSGGQPRISILYILRGEATAGAGMTAETAKRAIDTARTTIRNRLTSTTGDPQAMDKLSEPLIEYKPRESAGKPDAEGWSATPWPTSR